MIFQTFEGSYVGDAGGGYTFPVVPSSVPTWIIASATRPATLTPASGSSVTGTAGAAYTATEQGIINALVTLANNQKARLDDLETKLITLGALT